MVRISVSTKKKLLIAYFWCLLILPTFELIVDGEEIEGEIINYPKCLTQEPDVIPKKYPLYLDKKVIITIDVSPRITHKLTTYMFIIFIKEILGYERIVIHEYDDEFQLEPIIKRLADPKPKNTFPTSLINLETWISPDTDTTDIENSLLVFENGNSQPPGRFGWFIPMELGYPIRRYFKTWYNDLKSVHWAFLRDKQVISSFIIDDPNHLQLIKKYSIINDTEKEKKYHCMDEYCENGTFIPDHCKGNIPCALVLSSTYNETKFVIDHINELKLYAKVIWLGRNLKKVYNELYNDYIKKDEKNKSFIILYYTPSEIILKQENFLSIAFKSCQLINSTEKIGCKYELNRLVKFSWSKLEVLDKPLLNVLRNFHLNLNDWYKLIDIYENDNDINNKKNLYNISCKWMLENKLIWETWKFGSDRIIYIGGIFPITSSSYRGAGITAAANMAKDAINLNKNILPSYKLKLFAYDGKCNSDVVVKAFIDYVVESNYPNLLGILGPACSDTIEPLAGLSRHFKMLVISYSAERISFSNRNKYPYFFRTIGENNHYKYVYLNLFKFMKWYRIAALTEDGQRYTEYISQMQTLLEENNITFISNTKFPRETQTINIMKRYLDDLKLKRARIIILDVYENVARIVMCEAYKLKMTQYYGYVWFLPNWFNDTWFDVDYYNNAFKENVNCTTEQVLKAANGYFSMAHSYLAPDDTKVIGNITVADWKKQYYSKKFEMSRYSGYAYDAVWLYALALDNLSRSDPEALYHLHSQNTTSKLVKLIEDADFMGVSGRIKFRGGPSRFSVIDLWQFYDNKTNIIGHFNPNITDNLPIILGGELKLNMSAIRWYTKDGKRPKDGKLPPQLCTLESLSKFFNVDCQMAIVILNILVAFMLLIVVLASVYYIKKRYDKKVQNHENYFRHLGIDLLSPTSLSDLDKWEIPRESVVINRKLGEGAFGMVYGGEADFSDTGWVAVAVKTLKVGSTAEQKLDFLSEAEVMKRFDHKNIVKLLGVCTKIEPLYTVMEFMLYGDLKTFLLARRHLVNQKKDEENDEISNKKLTSMALDVARGLSYLAKIKYVHRDIASRNCLINAERVVKLGDFGMTRPMFENDYYKFSRKGMLPVRWMSPESLALGVFTPSSDVWSYGVLLYEIITFGSFPFQGLTNTQVLEHVKAGNTLQIPKGVKPQLVCLMKSCWAADPKKRTPASEIVEFLVNNPRLLAPCLDAPVSSVQIDDDQLDFKLPDQSRKSSTPNIRPSPSIPNGIGCGINNRDNSIDDTSITPSVMIENCCPKEPLLGTAKSSSSLINFGKYVQIHNIGNSDNKKNNDNDDDDDNDDEDNEYLPHNSGNNTFAISKV